MRSPVLPSIFTAHRKTLRARGHWQRRTNIKFQWWAVSLVNAVPFGGQKKGADSGIDGHIYFKPDGRTTEKAIVSVKGGDNVSVPMVRDLAHVVDREKARIGVFISLAEPTAPMKTEAVKAGYYETEFGKYPKIQIVTLKELFDCFKPRPANINLSSCSHNANCAAKGLLRSSSRQRTPPVFMR